MNQDPNATPPNEPDQPADPLDPLQAQPPMSLMGRLANAVAAPGEAFDHIKSRPVSHANWIVPLALVCVLAVVYTIVMFSQPAIVQQVVDQQEATFQKQVDSGKLTEKQKDEIMERTRAFMKPAFLMIMGSFGAVVVRVLLFNVITLGIWLLGRWVLKSPFDYLKGMELAGLTHIIAALGTVVSMLLVVITGNMNASLSPALFISDYDPTNKAHACLGALDAFSIWYYAALSLGLSRITGQPFAKAAGWLFLAWGVLRFGVIFLSPPWG